jgi:hypothetical protein
MAVFWNLPEKVKIKLRIIKIAHGKSCAFSTDDPQGRLTIKSHVSHVFHISFVSCKDVKHDFQSRGSCYLPKRAGKARHGEKLAIFCSVMTTLHSLDFPGAVYFLISDIGKMIAKNKFSEEIFRWPLNFLNSD